MIIKSHLKYIMKKYILHKFFLSINKIINIQKTQEMKNTIYYINILLSMSSETKESYHLIFNNET